MLSAGFNLSLIVLKFYLAKIQNTRVYILQIAQNIILNFDKNAF